MENNKSAAAFKVRPADDEASESLRIVLHELANFCMTIFQALYFFIGIYIIHLSYYISNHVIFTLIYDRMHDKILNPWFYTGLALVIISVVNIHYLVVVMNTKKSNLVLKLMFTFANCSVLFGALQFKQNEMNFMRNILYTNNGFVKESDTLISYVNDQCDTKDFSIVKLLTARYHDASLLLCSSYCPCTHDQKFDNQHQTAKHSILPQKNIGAKFPEYATRFQECQIHEHFMNGFHIYEKIAEILESKYQCSGFCKENSQFVFTNQPNITPKNSCKEALIKEYIKIKQRCHYCSNILIFSSFLMMLFHFLQNKYPIKRKQDEFGIDDSYGILYEVQSNHTGFYNQKRRRSNTFCENDPGDSDDYIDLKSDLNPEEVQYQSYIQPMTPIIARIGAPPLTSRPATVHASFKIRRNSKTSSQFKQSEQNDVKFNQIMDVNN